MFQLEREKIGEYARLAIQRHYDDLKKSESSNYPYYYDQKAAETYISFMKVCRLTKGEYAATNVNVMPWQEFFWAMIFGWKRKIDKKRRFRKVYLEIARKNAKTETAALTAVACFILDQEKGAEIYTAATTRDQARICWDAARVILDYLKKDSSAVNKMVQVRAHSIYSTQSNSKMVPVSSDAKTLDGLNPHIAIIDEMHAHPDSSILEIMESGIGSRTQPLILITTTAGFNKESPCYQLRKVCLDIIKGHKHDDAVFPLIFSLDEDDDWQNSDNWIKSNPSMNVTIGMGYLQDQYTKAINEGAAKQIGFMTKNLNYWTNTHATWINENMWNECEMKPKDDFLLNRPAFGGLDLAQTVDISAFCLFFPEFDGKPAFLLWKYWIPEDNVKERSLRDGVPYMDWALNGSIKVTNGNIVDNDAIINDIYLLYQKYNIRSLAYDPWRATHVVISLQERGVNVKPFPQSFPEMNTPICEFEKMITGKKVFHDGDPVAKWMLSNVALIINSTGLVKFDKRKSNEKIDGMVAAAMAIGEAIDPKNKINLDFNLIIG
jgi:phage terminase large subunit-like protein